MNLIVMISLRNLLRQKRRSILLGAAIALGVMILVVAGSFANGITDILLNKIVVRVAGHISVAFNEKGGLYKQIFRDKERIFTEIKKNVEGIREVEEAIGVFSRAIGNGKSDNVIMVGIDLSQTLSEQTRKETEESFKMLVGSFADLSNATVENPAILSEEKAKYLNLKVTDTLRIRYKNVFGNDDTARLTVIGIVKNDNVFMQGVMFASLDNVKRLMGYKPYEVGNINITVDNPRVNAVRYADKLHASIKPGIAAIFGTLHFKGNVANSTVLGLKSNDEAKGLIINGVDVLMGSKESVTSKDGVIISESLSKNLGISVGDSFEFEYKGKFEDSTAKVKYTVSAIIKDKSEKAKYAVFIGEKAFYDDYYQNFPEDALKFKDAFVPDKSDPLYNVYATEWVLLDRTMTTEDLQKKIRDISRGEWKGTTVDVRTMYESASDVLKLENVLNIITISAVLVLFFIILIGIVNTLRMAIRERTREIGTVRSIGMQKNEVRNSFILESLFLSAFASAFGVALSFIVMHLLSAMTIQTHDNPMSILLVNGHLYFKPTLIGVLGNIIFILAIVVITAYFPARRAANMSPSAALRHYE